MILGGRGEPNHQQSFVHHERVWETREQKLCQRTIPTLFESKLRTFLCLTKTNRSFFMNGSRAVHWVQKSVYFYKLNCSRTAAAYEPLCNLNGWWVINSKSSNEEGRRTVYCSDR
ncbi:hypothetical protein TNIN_457161 [Trichonephila inaurata madagascariensis]|uniref:Uncharacterized protein n=1 Tax=Trichonephila inaurata madagascariensis TaxID=2747483 RepID=A0A8X6ITC6_9ARAC|nr:hypothetical protein TNIN_457161 [Trichonephila inaurata madagascariensis]